MMRISIIVSCCILFLISDVVFAFTISFSPEQYSVSLGQDKLNQPFEINLYMENTEGLISPSSGLKDAIVFFNEFDITSWFLGNLKITAMNDYALTAKALIPSGLLPTGVYFFSVGVRNQQDKIFSTNAILVVGSPPIVSPPAGDSKKLRQLVEDSANRFIYIPGGRYMIDDNTMLRLKDNQVIWGAGLNSTILDGSKIATSGLSPVLVVGKNTFISSLKTENTSGGSGITLDGQVSAVVTNILSSKNKGGGVVAYNGASLHILASHLEMNSYDGATIGKNSAGAIIMTTATGNAFDGFGAEKTSSLFIDFCETSGNLGVGAGYFTQSSGAVLRTFLHNNQKACLFVGEGSTVQNISNNRIADCGSDGIGAGGQGSTISLVSGNMINGNVSGVSVNGAASILELQQNVFLHNINTNLSVTNGGIVSGNGNTFTGANIGIGVDGQASRITLSSDIITTAQELGILVANAATAKLTSLNISSNKKNGVSVVSGSKLDGSGLMISANNGFGLGINDSGSTAALSSSEISNNMNYGVIVFESRGASFRDQGNNNISGNTPSNIGRW